VTETEWDNNTDPVAMLAAVMPNASYRKRQLFCLGVWNSVADLLTDEWCSKALPLLDACSSEDWNDQDHDEWEAFDEALTDLDCELANRFWDRLVAGDSELEEAWESRTEARLTTWINANSVRAGAAVVTIAVAEGWVRAFGGGTVRVTPAELALRATLNAIRIGPASANVWAESFQAHTDLLREIFGNPFRPLVFPPSWRTDTALSLARQMYDSRDFGAMSILADALQDAGCDNEDVLNHCRGTNANHVRGCWVVDAVLGK
jgi:hypothetical protein